MTKRTDEEKRKLYELECVSTGESMGYTLEEVSPQIRTASKNLACSLDICEEHAYALLVEKIEDYIKPWKCTTTQLLEEKS